MNTYKLEFRAFSAYRISGDGWWPGQRFASRQAALDGADALRKRWPHLEVRVVEVVRGGEGRHVPATPVHRPRVKGQSK